MDVSVILPVYNAEQYLSIAIESVLAQSFSGNYEILIADDASTDSTAEIIKTYLTKYPSLIKAVFRKDNIGANPNSLSLCLAATGNYLAFIDADDIWLTKDKLQRQYDYLEAHQELGAVCSNSYFINNYGVKSGKGKGKKGLVSFEEMILGHTDIFCSSLVCRNEVYKRMVEDSAWYIKNGCFNDTVWAFWLSFHNLLYRMEEVFSAYRVLINSACHSTDIERQAALSKKYFNKKLCFLFSHEYPIDKKMDIISQEYDYVFKNAFYEGEMKVRNTKAFMIGKRIKKIASRLFPRKAKCY